MPKSPARPLYVVATDGSSGGQKAVDTAIALAKGAGADLEVVTVEDFPAVAQKVRNAPDFAKVMRLVREAADSVSLRARQRAEKSGVKTRSAVLSSADAAAAIVGRAEGRGADLIVVGSRGRTPIARMLLGSVAERVVQLAPCTVVVVR